MIQTGICPKCNELLEKVKIEVIKIEWARKSHDGISYVMSQVCCHSECFSRPVQME